MPHSVEPTASSPEGPVPPEWVGREALSELRVHHFGELNVVLPRGGGPPSGARSTRRKRTRVASLINAGAGEPSGNPWSFQGDRRCMDVALSVGTPSASKDAHELELRSGAAPRGAARRAVSRPGCLQGREGRYRGHRSAESGRPRG